MTSFNGEELFLNAVEVISTAYDKVISLLKKGNLNVVSCSVDGSVSVTWEIPNFSSYLFEDGEKLQSRHFSCCDAEWALGLLDAKDYENEGENTTRKGPGKAKSRTMKLCLIRISSRVKVHYISFKLGFENEKRLCGKIYQYGTECEIENTHWYPLFSFHREELEEYTNENILTVFFGFKLSYSSENIGIFTALKKEKIQQENAGIITLSHDLETVWGKGENCDVTLQVEDNKFPAHKLILGARSPVFEAMFDHDMLENRTDVVTISDIHPLAFKDVLQYIYTGRVRNLSTNKAIDLYKAADMYVLKDLKALCMETMLDGINLQNACELAVVANIYNDGKIMDSVVCYAHENSSAFLASKEWQTLLTYHSELASQILSATSQLAVKLK